MEIVKKILGGLIGLLGVMILFLLLCHFNPEISENIGNAIQANAMEADLKMNQESLVAEQEQQRIAQFPTITDTGLLEEIPQEYQEPDESTFEIPSSVAEKNGYEPVIENGKQISKPYAEEISQTLEKGNLGEDYAYDREYYPYYYMLNADNQSLYRQIHGNTDSLTKSFSPVVEDVTPKELKNAFTAVCNDHPELFWLNTSIGYKYAPSGKIVEIDLSFNYTANDLDTSKATFEKKAKDIVYQTRGLGTDYVIEKYIHDALRDQVTYDLNAPINQSAYSALVNNRTVCAGYARAFQYIMQQVKIPTYYCTGYAGQNHAWNITKLDGDYYNVDVTWDDTNPYTYDYFNCSDQDYAKDHARKDLSIYLPPCNGTKYSNLEENQADLEKRLKAEANKKKAELAEADKKREEKQAAEAAEKENTTKQPQQQVDKITLEFVRATTDGDIIILGSLQEYYTDCAQAMMDDGDNSISFNNIVKDEKLWNQIKKAYEKGDYNNGYMNRVLADKHKTACSATVTGQKLEDGTYLVRHIMTIK